MCGCVHVRDYFIQKRYLIEGRETATRPKNKSNQLDYIFLLHINYYYVYSTLLHILLSTGFYTGSHYLLDSILDNWWILSEMSKLDQKPVLDFHWILYWIIGGFLLNIKSTRFYVKSTRFPHLVLQKVLIQLYVVFGIN